MFLLRQSVGPSSDWECLRKRSVQIFVASESVDLNDLCSKLSRVAAERCEEKRREFSFEIGNYPPEYLVAADEAAVNILTTYRENGWALQGLRARKKCCFVRGTRYSSGLYPYMNVF